MKKIATVIILILTLTICCALLCGCKKYVDEGSIALNPSALEELKLSYLSGDVHFHSAESDFRVDYSLHFFTFKQPLNTIHVSEINTKTLIDVTNIHTFTTFKAKLDIYLPVSVLKTLKIEMTSGSIKAEALSLTKLEIHTTSGIVDISDSTISEAELDITSGNITLEGSITDVVDIDILSGKVNLMSDTIVKELNATITSGNINVYIPADPEGFTLCYHKTSGNIHSDFPLSGELDKRNGTLKCGKGTCQYNLRLTSGNISFLEY